MALSDPELELLKELLADDPGAEPWFQVGEELIRRGEWADAENVISGGLTLHQDRVDAWPLLARASLELGHVGLALVALENVAFDPQADPEAARVRILALERAGEKEDAREAANAFLGFDPDDVVVTSVIERLDGGGAQEAEVVPGRVPDPFVSLERAERYIAVGRPDRALRVYRRILFHSPGLPEAVAALQSLGGDVFPRQMTEDLSEELINPASAPPTLDMPEPRLSAMVADEEITEPGKEKLGAAIQAYAQGGGKHPLPPDFGDEDDELTDPFAPVDIEGKLSTKARAPRRRRRRRSLLNR